MIYFSIYYSRVSTMSSTNQQQQPDCIEYDNAWDKVTGYRVYDCTWHVVHECSYEHCSFDYYEDFETLEEAMAEFKRRCTEYAKFGDDVSSVYLEEMGTDEDGDAYPIDCIEYWERISMEEHVKNNK